MSCEEILVVALSAISLPFSIPDWPVWTEPLVSLSGYHHTASDGIKDVESCARAMVVAPVRQLRTAAAGSGRLRPRVKWRVSAVEGIG
jgi:hypothetical protein